MDFPSLEDIARLWYAGPNALKIAAAHRRFFQMGVDERELFVLALDLEEGILPRIHLGGGVSRQHVVNDGRLLSSGGLFDYRNTLAASRPAPASSASSAAASPTSSRTETAKAACAPRTVDPTAAEARYRPRCVSPADVLTEDRLAAAMWFPQFELTHRNRELPFWTGVVRPLDPAGGTFQLRATYQPDHLAPLRMTVLGPALAPRAPHRYANGDLCTFYAPLGSWVRGRPDDDLVELLRFAVTWLVRYTCWMTFDGWWPGVDVPHDPAYLVGTLRDDDHCPYHSPRLWGDCCKAPQTRLASEQRARQERLEHGLIRPIGSN